MPIINSVAETSSSEDESGDFPIGKIKQASDDSRHGRKRYEIIPDSSDTLIVENEPVERLEGVIKASDPSEWQKPIDVERGATKNLASKFLNIGQSDTTSKKPFKLDIDENAETIVAENEPVVLEGVVRSVDKTEDVIGKRGRIKNLAGRFVNPSKLSDDEDAQNEEKQKQKTIEIDTSKTRMIQEKWKQQHFNGPAAEDKPREKVELVSAAEYGVYENEPAVRSDVVKGGVEQPDVIHVKHTRNLRKMWCQFEQQELAKERDSKNIESIVKAKKKEVQPEPEPEPHPLPPVQAPVEETKPGTRKFGSKVVKKEAEKITEPQQNQANSEANAGFQKPTLRSVKRRF